MKTHELQLIETVDLLNDRNARIRQGKPYGHAFYDELGIVEVIVE